MVDPSTAFYLKLGLVRTSRHDDSPWVYRCASCAAEERYAPSYSPHGLSEAEARMAGWSSSKAVFSDDPQWFCPPCAKNSLDEPGLLLAILESLDAHARDGDWQKARRKLREMILQFRPQYSDLFMSQGTCGVCKKKAPLTHGACSICGPNQ